MYMRAIQLWDAEAARSTRPTDESKTFSRRILRTRQLSIGRPRGRSCSRRVPRLVIRFLLASAACSHHAYVARTPRSTHFVSVRTERFFDMYRRMHSVPRTAHLATQLFSGDAPRCSVLGTRVMCFSGCRPSAGTNRSCGCTVRAPGDAYWSRENGRGTSKRTSHLSGRPC